MQVCVLEFLPDLMIGKHSIQLSAPVLNISILFPQVIIHGEIKV